MRGDWRRTLAMAAVLACAAGSATGDEYAFVGARAAGMGGANAVTTRDASAQWHNPAAFGFFGREEWAGLPVDKGNLAGQHFSWNLLDAGAGYTMTEDMGRYLDILGGLDFSTFGQGVISNSAENVKTLLGLTAVIGSLDSGDALYADASAGTSVQIGHFGIGLRVFGEGAAWTLSDTDNLSLDSFPNLAALVDEFQNAAIGEGFAWDGSYTLDDDQRAQLASKLGNIDVDGDVIKYLDAKFQELKDEGTLNGSDINNALDIFDKLDPAAAGLALASNLTAVAGHGFTVVEVPVSYGYAINENLSFGITAKAMYGSVLGTKIWIFNEDNEKVLESVGDNVENTFNVGLDLGALYRMSNFQFALVGRNLNRPTFEGFTADVPLNGVNQEVVIPDVNLDPQVTFGAAFVPTRRFMLETNYELLETGTLLQDYNIQRLSFGGEFDVWVLALRLGAYRNLAADWADWVATAGVGLNIFGVRLDVGGAYSLGDPVDYEGASIPPEARLNASIQLNF